MSYINYFSYRIFKRNCESFKKQEFEEMKSQFFNSSYLKNSNRIYTSIRTPIIFELIDGGLCIETQFDTHSRDIVFISNIEKLYEKIYPFYEFWFITCFGAIDYDTIGNYGLFNNNEKNSKPNIDWEERLCKYQYDEIHLKSPSGLPKELSHITWERKKGIFYAQNLIGYYNSNSQKHSEENLNPKTGLLKINDKYSPDKSGIEEVVVDNYYYSDRKLSAFLDVNFRQSQIEKITFFFKGRKTREIFREKYELYNEEILCFDGWDNCADISYLNYLKERQ